MLPATRARTRAVVAPVYWWTVSFRTASLSTSAQTLEHQNTSNHDDNAAKPLSRDAQSAPEDPSHTDKSSFDALFAGLPPAPKDSITNASRSAGSSEPGTAASGSSGSGWSATAHKEPLYPLQRGLQQHNHQQRQRQNLSQKEQQSFTELLASIIPAHAAQSPPDGPLSNVISRFPPDLPTNQLSVAPGGSSDKVQQALRLRLGKRIRGKTELGDRERAEIDRLRARMVQFDSDVELLRWSMTEVLGFDLDEDLGTVFPDVAVVTPPMPSGPLTQSPDSANEPLPRGPASPIYPDLLLMLFLLLRDMYNAPHAAMHVFQLAASSPYSYVRGCTTALYNELLKTRWLEGDVESVAAGIDEMRGAGVKIDERTRDVVEAIGQAMRRDLELAEARVKAQRTHDESQKLDDSENDQERTIARLEREEHLVASLRLFSPRQVAAWARMERVVQDNLDEAVQRQRALDDERWAAREAARARQEQQERRTAERERPNLFF